MRRPGRYTLWLLTTAAVAAGVAVLERVARRARGQRNGGGESLPRGPRLVDLSKPRKHLKLSVFGLQAAQIANKVHLVALAETESRLAGLQAFFLVCLLDHQANKGLRFRRELDLLSVQRKRRTLPTL